MFLERFASPSTAYTGHYDLQLILLSLVVSTLAIYIAFRISERMYRVRKVSAWFTHLWWLGGALIMGTGFWSLYFIGLLAYRPPVETSVDLTRALLYLFPAILGSGLLLHFRASNDASTAKKWVITVGLGLGIGLTQFAGLTAVQGNAEVKYDAAYFSLTCLAAVALSWLVLNARWRYEASGHKRSLSMPTLLVSSLVLCVASLGIQQAAILSVYFVPGSPGQVPTHWLLENPVLASWTLASIVLAVSLIMYLVVRHGYQLAMSGLLERGINETLKSLNDSSEGIVTTDSWGTITSFNHAAEEMFGYPSARVIGENCLSLLPGKIADDYKSLLQDAGPSLSGLINRTHEMIFRKADGSKFQAELVISPLSRQNSIEFVGMIRDNSAAKLLKSEKQKFQEKLEFLVKASPVTIYSRELSCGLPFSYVGPNVRRLMGYDADQITASVAFWSELVHPDDVDCYSLDRKALLDGTVREVEYRLRTPDGGYRWISDTRHLVVDDEGKPSLLIGCWRDIQQRKETALRLELNQERLNISLKLAKMATWDWIISTGEVIWSEDMQEKLGLRRDQAASFQNFIDIVHPDDRRAVKAAFKQSLLNDAPFDLEYRILWPDQSIHWLHSAGGLISDSGGNPTHMVGVLHEINEPVKLYSVPNQTTFEKEAAAS